MTKYIGISKPLLVVDGKHASLDAKYGPYDSINHATSSIPIAVRRVGLTVGIIFLEGTVETVKDYWWKKGIEDTNLELKIDNAASTKTSQLENDADFQDGNQVSASLQAQKNILDAVDVNLQSQINTHSGQITTINQKNTAQDTQIQDIITSYIDNKGYFATLTSLQASYPTPEIGDTAYVADALSSTGFYIYNVVGGIWTASTVEAPPVTVPLNDYTLSGGSPKTLKEVEDEIAQFESDVEQLAYVKIKNEAVNGNFENGLRGSFRNYDDDLGGESTLAINSSTPISGNYDIRFTIITPSTATRPYLTGLNRTDENIGDKIYLHFYAKILSGMPIIGGIRGGGDITPIYGGDVVNGRNTRIIDVEGTGGVGTIYFRSESVWDMQMDNFMRINLTEAFGAGAEPTEEEMNLLLDMLPVDYFEGEITITAQKIMQWQQKLTVSKITNILESRKELEYNTLMENKGFVPTPLEKEYLNAYSWINSVEVYSDSGNQYRLTEFNAKEDGITLRFRNVADAEISKAITSLPLSSRVVVNINGDVIIFDYSEKESVLRVNSPSSPLITTRNTKVNNFYNFLKTEQFELTGAPTYENDCIKSANVKWVDGETGVLTYNDWNDDYGAFMSWIITHPFANISQPAISVVDGNITLVPEKIITYK